MKYQLTLVLFLFSLLLFAPLHTASAQNQYEEQVLAQLYEAAEAFIEVGYAPIMGDGDMLDDGDSDLYTVTLEAGITYLLLGVCDEDCTDLDLELYDGYDNLISRDEEEDDTPVVEVVVADSGTFTLKVTMYACHENPCYYGVGVYGN